MRMRALAVAATAAVLLPASLAAPAARASGDRAGPSSVSPAAATPSTTVTAPAPSSTSPAAPGTPTASASGSAPATPGRTSGTPTATGGSSAPSTPAATQSSPPDASPSASPPAPPGGSPEDPDVPNGFCDVAAFDVRISGLPATVAAGTTTEPFTVVLDNGAGVDAAHVQFGMAVAFREGLRTDDWLAAQEYVSVQYYDWTADVWRDASTGAGVYAYTDVEAGREYRMRLRLVLAADTPPGAAGALAFSTRWKPGPQPGAGECVYDNEWYRFEITGPGVPPVSAEVRPMEGRNPVVLRPESTDDEPDTALLDGALATTGRTGLPLLGLGSVTAVALGAVMLLAVRRRG